MPVKVTSISRNEKKRHKYIVLILNLVAPDKKVRSSLTFLLQRILGIKINSEFTFLNLDFWVNAFKIFGHENWRQLRKNQYIYMIIYFLQLTLTWVRNISKTYVFIMELKSDCPTIKKCGSFFYQSSAVFLQR